MMPWWGWIIASGLVAVCVTWVIVVALAGRNFQRIRNQMDKDHEKWRRDHGFDRWPRR